MVNKQIKLKKKKKNSFEDCSGREADYLVYYSDICEISLLWFVCKIFSWTQF